MKGLPAALALLLALAGAAQAQTAENADQLIARWTASDTTCRNPAASAVDAVGACEQRDTLAKVLALAGFCHASAADRSGPAWTRCPIRGQQEATRATARSR